MKCEAKLASRFVKTVWYLEVPLHNKIENVYFIGVHWHYKGILHATSCRSLSHQCVIRSLLHNISFFYCMIDPRLLLCHRLFLHWFDHRWFLHSGYPWVPPLCKPGFLQWDIWSHCCKNHDRHRLSNKVFFTHARVVKNT